MAMTNTEIKNTRDDNSINILRKFSRRVKSSGVVKKSKSLRYDSRSENKFLRKKHALRSIRKNAEKKKLIKLGKIQENRNTSYVNKTLSDYTS